MGADTDRSGWHVTVDGPGAVEIEIGMGWLSLWRLAARPWVPLAFAGMVRPADNQGLLRSGLRVTPSGPAIVQVWRDRPTLDAWSRSAGAAHLGPWRRFRREAEGTADWGIWHRVRSAPPA
jgi:hypothetical protein